MKKTLLFLLLLSLLLSAAACQSAAPAAPAATETPAEAAPAPEPEATAEAEREAEGVRFTTTDREGAAWDESVFAEHSLTMINFWEPWCPPCVGEMPELEKLYENYAEQGFTILGVYSTADREDEVDAVLAQCGTSYPILHYCPDFDLFQSGYVPTTVFVDSRGQLVGEMQIGALSYEGWAALVEALL